MDLTKATPRPWCQGNYDWDIIGPADEPVAQTYAGSEATGANAELIVRAVNAHEDLLAAAELALDRLSAAVVAGGGDPATHIVCGRLRAALAKAKGNGVT